MISTIFFRPKLQETRSSELFRHTFALLSVDPNVQWLVLTHKSYLEVEAESAGPCGEDEDEVLGVGLVKLAQHLASVV